VDGCVTFQFLPERVRSSVREANLPCVLLGDNSDPDWPHIVVDDPAGAYSATRHLIALGHRRIGMYVHSSIKPHCSIAERRQGFEQAMREAGLEPKFWHCGEDDMISVLVRGDGSRPTGLICYCDLEATLITHAMWQYGLKIPGDLSIIGFNEKFATRYMMPPLTTVAFDARQIGTLGAQMIIRSISGDVHQTNGDGHAKGLRVKTQLIVRGSTAAPPNN
jgi:DNA-binding LacI/PurR family transcriptional regulator